MPADTLGLHKSALPPRIFLERDLLAGRSKAPGACLTAVTSRLRLCRGAVARSMAAWRNIRSSSVKIATAGRDRGTHAGLAGDIANGAARTASTRQGPAETSASDQANTQAVRDAEVYPPVARMMKQHGKAIVEFTYFQGHASDVALRESSGYPLLDRAAIEAVQSASYPAAPAILGHSSRRLTIGVEFNIVEGAAE